MRRFVQVIFILSVIGLTIFCFYPFLDSGVTWNDAFPGIFLFGLAVIVSGIIYSVIRPVNDPSGKKFGPPRIGYGWVGLWGTLVGIIMVVASSIKLSEAKSYLEFRYARSLSTWGYKQDIYDAQALLFLGGVILGIGIISGSIAVVKAKRKRRRVRLEI